MALSSKNRPTVGVLAGWQFYEGTIPTGFLEPLYRGILAAAEERGCNLLMACGMHYDPESHHPAWPIVGPEEDFVPVGPWNTDGLIVIPALLSEKRSRYIQELIKDGHPVVFIGNGENGATIVADSINGINQALIHLVSHGHSRIAFIGGKEEDTGESLRRLEAYRSFVRENGLMSDDRLIAFGNFNRLGGVRAMRRILNSGISFTAVITFNDELAKGVIKILQDAGRKIPEDVAVIGFDDQLDARSQTPLLTTVHQPIFELGFRGLNWLLDRMAGKAMEEDLILLPTRLVIRRSCGCLPETLLTPTGISIPPISARSLTGLQTQLTRIVKEAVLAEIRQLGEDQVVQLCHQLVMDLSLSLEQADPLHFRSGFMAILSRVETVGDDIYAWLPAIAVLEKELPALLNAGHWLAEHRLAEELLNQARAMISERMRWQYTRHLIRQTNMVNQLGQMMARSQVTFDESHILNILTEYLPELGVHYAQVIFLKPDGDDPIAWSILPNESGSTSPSPPFPTRRFPPPDMCPPDRPFHLALLPLIIQDTLSGYMVFDASNLEPCAAIVRQVASALRSARLYQEAAHGRELAEEANRLKSRFLSSISHELRTPLDLIVGLSEILLLDEFQPQGPLPVPYRQDVENIHTSAQHLGRIIRDLLDLSSSDAGQLRLEVEPLDLAEVLEIVVVTGEQLTRSKNLVWEAQIPPDLPVVWGDRTRLRQVALNLVSNAVKFTNQGKIMLTVEANSEIVTVSVSDTGLGIPSAEQRLIFNEFRQSERTAARGYGGLGLGLAICKRLVELHGGTIGVHSSGKDGLGSTFYFTLPVIKNVESLPQLAAQSQYTVLLLTEHSDNTDKLRDHLAQQGFEASVLSVHNDTAQWLPALLAAPPGAILLDFPLASQRGWEIMKLLKGNPATNNIPILFYSLLQENNAGSVLALNYIAKPLSPSEVKEALEQQGLFTTLVEEKTILIVDDEPGILEMHARIIQAQAPHYRILKARDGPEALTLIREALPDLVLLDLMMPQMDGFSVIEAMQQEEMTRGIPVIVLTAQVLTEDDMARLNRGVAMVLSKGMFSTKETFAHVEEILARNHKLGNETQRIVRKAMAYLHAHYVEPISPEMLATHVGISKGYLFRSFRQEMGITPMNYLNRYRVNRAKELLTVSDKSITEVALFVGFSDSAHFTRLFQKEVGVSPSAYRRGQRKTNN